MMTVVDAEAGAAAAAAAAAAAWLVIVVAPQAPQDGPCAGMVRLARVPQSSGSVVLDAFVLGPIDLICFLMPPGTRALWWPLAAVPACSCGEARLSGLFASKSPEKRHGKSRSRRNVPGSTST